MWLSLYSSDSLMSVPSSSGGGFRVPSKSAVNVN